MRDFKGIPLNRLRGRCSSRGFLCCAKRRADDATFAGGEYLYISPTSVKIVAQGDTISEVENTPIRLPHV